MNSLFSIGVIYFLYKTIKKSEGDNIIAMVAALITLFSPLFFLGSISLLTEPVFCFFLIVSIYLYYEEKYFFSALLISLLPMIRPEGILYILVWVPFLVFKSKISYLSLLVVPSLIWSLLVRMILKLPLISIFLYVNRGFDSPPPHDSLMSFSAIGYYFSLYFLPIFLLFAAGLIMKAADRRYWLLISCLLVQFLLVVANNITLFVLTKSLCNQLRFLIPVIPIFAFFAAFAFVRILRYLLKKMRDIPLLVISIAVFATLFSFQMKDLQSFPGGKDENTMSFSEEMSLREVNFWLKGWLKENDIKNVYFEGGQDFTGRILRRVYINLPVGLRSLVVIDRKRLFNPSTFEVFTGATIDGVFVSSGEASNTTDLSGCKLLRSYPDIQLYFFRINDGVKQVRLDRVT